MRGPEGKFSQVGGIGENALEPFPKAFTEFQVGLYFSCQRLGILPNNSGFSHAQWGFCRFLGKRFEGLQGIADHQSKFVEVVELLAKTTHVRKPVRFAGA